VTAPGSPSARQLLADGHLEAAIEALGIELRHHPDDAQRRVFLFELLVFAGQYDRARKQLDVLATKGTQTEAGTLVYRAALEAERVREHMFDTGDYPSAPALTPVRGTLNGHPFSSLTDADPRLGARLEVIAGGRYLWLPFAHLATLHLDPPTRLRDLRWAPARLATGPSVRDMELGEVLLPALTPAAYRDEEDAVRLGRATAWVRTERGEEVPIGGKLWLVDGEELPLLEVRDLVIHADDTVPAA
jgi:type VI secretion system protein ImpE